jgi:hypothetical protein
MENSAMRALRRDERQAVLLAWFARRMAIFARD